MSLFFFDCGKSGQNLENVHSFYRPPGGGVTGCRVRVWPTGVNLFELKDEVNAKVSASLCTCAVFFGVLLPFRSEHTG